MNNIQSLNGLQEKIPYQHVSEGTGDIHFRNCIHFDNYNSDISLGFQTTSLIIRSTFDFDIIYTSNTNYVYVINHKNKLVYIDSNTTLKCGNLTLYPKLSINRITNYRINEYVNTYKDHMIIPWNQLGYANVEWVRLTRGMRSPSELLKLTNPDITDLLIDAREILGSWFDYLYPDPIDETNLHPGESFEVNEIPVFLLD